MRFPLLSVATILFPLAIPMAHAELLESGGIPYPSIKTTVVTPTNVAAGIGNAGVQNVGDVANGIKVHTGPGGSVDTSVVVPSNVVAGIGNFGAQNVGGIANFSRRR